MGEAKRRQLAGNTKPDKNWNSRKAAERHAKQVSREMAAAARVSPIGTAMSLLAASRK